MAKILQTPSVNLITPFDPSYENIIRFSYTDNQPTKNRLVITDNSTSNIIYDKIQSTMKLQHILASNILISGKQYLAQIQVFDVDGNSSNLSNPVLFYCLSTPVFAFTNITDGMEHKNANMILDLKYTQNENETLKSYQFFMYSMDKILLESSSIFYSSSSLSHTFYGLQNNSVYYFRATGETSKGILLDTGYIQVNVFFNTIPANILFEAENNYKEGYVSIRLNIKDIGYETENDDYVLEDGMLILKDNSLKYNNGFELEGDLSLFVEAKELPTKKFLETETFALSIVNVCGVFYCELSIKNSSFVQYVSLPKAKLITDDNAYLSTDEYQLIEIVDNTYGDNVLVVFEVRRINGYYNLDVYYKSEKLN